MQLSKIQFFPVGILIILFLAMILGADPVIAALRNENLITPLPEGFKTGFQAEKDHMTMIEYVPQEETVNNWSKMITVQLFHGIKNYDPNAFASEIGKRWKSACINGDAQHIRSGNENGYPVSLWMLTCPLNPETKKPENTWLKVISGADSLYSVQYAYRKELGKELIVPAMSYLKQVVVCDSRHIGSCPHVN